MPRGVSRYDEALRQGRLWSPRLLGSRLEGLWTLTDLPTGQSPDGAGFTVSSGTIPQLTDRSGKGRHLTSSAQATYKTSGFTGEPTADFTAGSVTYSTASFSLSQPLGIVSLFRNTAALPQYCGMFTAPSNNFRYFGRRIDTSDLPVIYAGGASGFSVGSSALAVNTNYVLTGVFNGSSSYGCVNGGTLSTGDPGTDGISGGLKISQSTAEFPDTYWIGELSGLVLISSPTLADIRRTEGWLAWRAGLSSLLVASHPCRNRPPLIGA